LCVRGMKCIEIQGVLYTHLIQRAENKGIRVILSLFLGQSSRVILETDKCIQIWYWGLYARKYFWFSLIQ